MTNRELDAKVAEDVMGWTIFPYEIDEDDFHCINKRAYCPPGVQPHISTVAKVPHYSSDWSCMRSVVERMEELGWVWFVDGDETRFEEKTGNRGRIVIVVFVSPADLPRAVSEAAWKAVTT